MNRLVVDSSVAIKWFIPEPYSAQARLLLDRYQSGQTAFLAPDLLNAEIGNILWKKQRLQNLGSVDAHVILNTFQELKLEFTPTAALLIDAHRLAVQYERTVYDMLYIALSIREACPFVTADERLVNAVKHQMSNIIWLADWTSTPEES